MVKLTNGNGGLTKGYLQPLPYDAMLRSRRSDCDWICQKSAAHEPLAAGSDAGV